MSVDRVTERVRRAIYALGQSPRPTVERVVREAWPSRVPPITSRAEYREIAKNELQRIYGRFE